MKSRTYPWRFRIALVLTLLSVRFSQPASAAFTNIYNIGFEGYKHTADLVGQGPWVGFGSGGSGILSDFFPGEGQQAYVGYSPPESGDDQLVVWPTNRFDPVALGMPLVKFSVLMQIADSSNGEYDYFNGAVQISRVIGCSFSISTITTRTSATGSMGTAITPTRGFIFRRM